MDIRVEAVAQADRLSYQFLVAPPSNPEREVGAAVWAEMCAGYFGVASPAVRESVGFCPFERFSVYATSPAHELV